MKIPRLLGLLHKQSSLDFGSPQWTLNWASPSRNTNSFWNGRKQEQNVIWSYDILASREHTKWTSNVRQADADRKYLCQHSELDLCWQWNPGCNASALKQSPREQAKPGLQVRMQAPWWGLQNSHRSSDWKFGLAGRALCFICCWEMNKTEKLTLVPCLPGSLSGKQDNTQYRNKIQELPLCHHLNRSWHKFALTSAPNGSNMKFIFLKCDPGCQ